MYFNSVGVRAKLAGVAEEVPTEQKPVFLHQYQYHYYHRRR